MTQQIGKSPTRKGTPTYIYSMISISLVLLLLGIICTLVLSASQLSDYFRENIEVSVIVRDGMNETELFQFQKRLEGEPYVKTIEYISKEEAARRLQQDLGENFLDLLGYNPLFASFNLYLHSQYANVDSLKMISDRISRYNQVKEVYYQESLVDLINKNVRNISLILLVLTAVLVLIAITLIDNTLRLAMYSSRFLIKSMQLVGATRGFIIKPFLLRSIFNGLISSLLAILGLIGLIWYFQHQVTGLKILENAAYFALIFTIIVLTGLLISFISTYFAVRKYLRLKLDDLY